MSIAFVKLEDISLASYEGLYLHIELNKDNINVTLYETEAEDCKQICKLEVYNVCEAINVALKMKIPVEFYEV